MDSAYAKDPALNRSSWNKDWAVEKQKLWDMVIDDYETAIALTTGSLVPTDKSSGAMLQEELALALADYKKAAAVSSDPAFTGKMKESLEFIEAWSNETGM